jgi:hypothetical protein
MQISICPEGKYLMEKLSDGSQNTTGPDVPASPRTTQKTSYRPLLIVAALFILLVVIVFVTHKEIMINWVTDYDKAVQIAKAQNKPLLLVFYKPNAPMAVDAFQNTYNNAEVKKFVEANFVPVLINVDQQPDLARRFNISYYPTHYVKSPDSDKLFGPRLGWDPPNLFIKEITKLLNRMKNSAQ